MRPRKFKLRPRYMAFYLCHDIIADISLHVNFLTDLVPEKGCSSGRKTDYTLHICVLIISREIKNHTTYVSLALLPWFWALYDSYLPRLCLFDRWYTYVCCRLFWLSLTNNKSTENFCMSVCVQNFYFCVFILLYIYIKNAAQLNIGEDMNLVYK